MRLFGGTYSGYTQKVRIALAEKQLTEQIPFVLVHPDERGGVEYRRRNPLGLVPVLELDDGTSLPESSAIIEYLDALFPTPQLVPSDPLTRARVHVLDRYHDQALTPHVRVLWNELTSPGTAAPAALAAARTKFAAAWAHLDAVLAGHDYLIGDFSLADIAFMPRLQILPWIGVEIPASGARTRAWLTRLQARPSWSATQFPPLERVR